MNGWDVRVAAYAVIRDADRVLLAHWRERGRHAWTLPGGGVEPGEHPDDAVVREVLEETGYHVERGPILGTDSYVIPAEERLVPSGRPMHGIRLFYTARIVGGELRNEVDGSTDEAAWFLIDEVPRLEPRAAFVDIALGMASR